MEMQVIRLSQSLKEQLLNIIDLHQGYFGEDCQTLLAAIQGVYCEKHIDRNCKDIINRVEQATGIGYSAMKARTRMRNVTIARQYAIYRVHRELYGSGYSLQDIGKMFFRDHSTVLYSIKTMKHALQVQDKLVKSIHTKYGELESEGA
jgi:chromosomal replication initiator protein